MSGPNSSIHNRGRLYDLAMVPGAVRSARSCQECQELSGVPGAVKSARSCQECQELSGVTMDFTVNCAFSDSGM